MSQDFRIPKPCVTAVTECVSGMGDTPVVNMVRRASKKALLEPGDTKQQWKGEAAASFVSAGIASSRTLPTSSAGYWSPLLSCDNTSASEAKRSFGGDFLRAAKPNTSARRSLFFRIKKTILSSGRSAHQRSRGTCDSGSRLFPAQWDTSQISAKNQAVSP